MFRVPFVKKIKMWCVAHSVALSYKQSIILAILKKKWAFYALTAVICVFFLARLFQK